MPPACDSNSSQIHRNYFRIKLKLSRAKQTTIHVYLCKMYLIWLMIYKIGLSGFCLFVLINHFTLTTCIKYRFHSKGFYPHLFPKVQIRSGNWDKWRFLCWVSSYSGIYAPKTRPAILRTSSFSSKGTALFKVKRLNKCYRAHLWKDSNIHIYLAAHRLCYTQTRSFLDVSQQEGLVLFCVQN